MGEQKTKVIAKAKVPDQAAALSICLTLGIWDAMSFDERQAFCERGEVWDTQPGRVIHSAIQRMTARSSHE